MNERTPVLVLGLGNVVCTDDGAGIAAIHKLIREYEFPEGVSVKDGGTLGLSLDRFEPLGRLFGCFGVARRARGVGAPPSAQTVWQSFAWCCSLYIARAMSMTMRCDTA